jgi:hypothetical protein
VAADDEELLARQAVLQREAEKFVRELGLVELLGRAGRVIPLGSAVTGLMVWRDLDFGVDAPGLTADAAWETMRPVLRRCSSLHYANDPADRRHYFVMRIEGWKVDVSLWFAGVPPAVEAFQVELPARLTHESRPAILRLKDWHLSPRPGGSSSWSPRDRSTATVLRRLARRRDAGRLSIRFGLGSARCFLRRHRRFLT